MDAAQRDVSADSGPSELKTIYQANLGYDIDKDGASTKKLMERISSGNLSNLIVIGEDLATLPGGGAALKKLAAGSLIYIGPRRNATADAADLRIPSSAYGEFEGTWINFKGRAQRVRRGVTKGSVARGGRIVVHRTN